MAKPSKSNEQDNAAVQLNPEEGLAKPYDWQQSNWQHLHSVRQAGRLPHAILLHGQQGVGKRNFARALAQSFLCEQPADAAVACGQCRSCLLHEANSHPDLVCVEPEEKGKQIKIDQIRELIDYVAKTPQLGNEKFVLVNPAEQLNLASANAFLKCLEEPGEHTTLLLVTNNFSELLPTIRSRCQAVLLETPNRSSVLPWLNQHIEDLTLCERLLCASQNRPLLALELYLVGAWELKDLLVKKLQALKADEAAVVAIAKELQKHDSEWLMFWLESFLLDILRWYPTKDGSGSTPMLRNPDLPQFYQSVMALGQYEGTFALLDEILLIARQVNGAANANLQLAIENILILWSRWQKGRG